MKKHREKQGLALLLSMAIFCALPRFGFRAEAAGGADAYWASFARDSGNAAVAESKLPISLERTEILLNGQAEKLAAKEPVIVGERMYTVVGTKLACYDLQGRPDKRGGAVPSGWAFFPASAMATARSLCCSATVSRPLTPERWNPSG